MTRIGEWIAGGLDPVKLAKRLQFNPDRWQRDLLRCTDRYVHVVSSRQVGKSTTTAVLALHTALFKPASVVLIFSPSERQSAELYRKIAGFYRQLDKPIAPEGENIHSLTLENGSRILSLPASETNVRGFTATLILEDEAAYVSDELFAAVTPMLAVSGGRMVLMGTPAGQRGHFFETSQSDGWRHFVVPATECPRIPADFLESERESLGDIKFEQEYMCSWRDSTGAAFRAEDIAAMFDAQRPLPPQEPAERSARPSGDLVAAQRFVDARRGAVSARQRREQMHCTHRWNANYGAPYCVNCQLAKEVFDADPAFNRRRPGPSSGPYGARGRGVLPGHRFG